MALNVPNKEASDRPGHADSNLDEHGDPLWLRNVVHDVAEDGKTNQECHFQVDLSLRKHCIVDSETALDNADHV